MKKFLVFLLLIAMFSMVACSNDDTAGNLGAGADAPAVGGITTTTEATTEDPHEGWTWLIGEVYIPDLPFEDWKGQNQDNISCYTVFIESRNSAAFHTYAKSLADFGYKLEQTEDFYYTGTDPEGRKISLSDPGNGFMTIDIYYNSN